ncbi:MAG: heme ABC transporter ATP-binding protein [Burkholderiales bacterium]|nr:heme ABC transporter ATP-binding protein [Burkholderiales bacterium]
MLEAIDVTVRIGTRKLLDRVSLSVHTGETAVIVGENGAGKSTLLKLFAGDRLPARARTEGRVRVAGRELAAWPLAARARLRAVLPQRPELAFAFTAREVAAFGRYPVSTGWHDRRDREIVDAALALADATHLAGREVTTLSGGEQARVHLAAAFAQLWEADFPHPRFLLLDEPTAALDLAHQHALLVTARAFAAQRNVGIFAILHDLNLAATYADRVVVLHQGRVLAQGAPGAVLQPATIAAGFGVAAQVLRHPITGGILIATAAATDAVGVGHGGVSSCRTL